MSDETALEVMPVASKPAKKQKNGIDQKRFFIAKAIESKRDEIKEELKRYDKDMQTFDSSHKSVVKMWEQACAIQDPNELINSNIRHVQTLLDQAINAHYKMKKIHAEVIKDAIAEKRITDADSYRMLKAELLEEERESVKMITTLSKNLTDMSKEFRQCLIGQKFFVHVSILQKLFCVFKQVLSAEIHDKGLLKKIAERFDDDSKAVTIDIENVTMR